MKRLILTLAALLAAVTFATAQNAIPTKISVRVQSKDAKFIGTSMGGVAITIRNSETGEILAKGKTAGSTGNTQKIMRDPKKRGVAISDDKSAKFTAKLMLSEPVLAEIEAYGPLAQRQSANKVSITQWILPGKDIVQGDAILLQMPGFAVDILNPATHSRPKAGEELTITTNVIMMCGCPTSPGGMWNSDDIEIKAVIKRGNETWKTVDLSFSGTDSIFEAKMTPDQPGAYEIMVYAYNAKTGNTGVDWATVVVSG